MKNLYKFMIIATAATVAAACSKTGESAPQDEPVIDIPTNAFLAGTETKVSLQSDKSLWWDENDAVKVSDGTTVSEYTASASGATTTLVGDEVDESKTYYAVYPAANALSFSGVTATIEVPYYQSPVKDNFPVNPMVASSTGADRSFAFKNICGLIGFEISKSDIASVVIYANGGEAMTGQVAVDCTSAAPSATVVSGTEQNGVILASISAFETGTYWVAVLPRNYSAGITCTMFNTAGEMVQKSTSNAFTLQRSHRVEISAIDGGTASDAYNITNALELRAFLAAAPSCAASVVATLGNDIDLAGMTLAPATSFAGTFNGGNHKLLNWTTTSALFAEVKEGAVVKNIIIDASCSMEIPANDDCAFIALENGGTIENCLNNAPMTTVSGAVFDSDEPVSIGAFAAVSSGTIAGCTNNAAVSLSPESVTKAGSSTQLHSARYLGGVVGKVVGTGGSAKVTDCINTGTVSYTSAACISAKSYVGGVVGGTPATLSTALNTWAACGDNAVIEGCTNNGDVVYKYDVQEISCLNEPNTGGVAGYIEGSVKDCTNTGKVTVSAPTFEGANATNQNYYIRCSKTGGVAGTVSGSVSGCSNSGEVSMTGNISNAAYGEYVGSSANPCVGGVVGEGAFTGSITNCNNSGKITVNNTKCWNSSPVLQVGGVVGHTATVVDGCDNSGAIDVVTEAKEASVGGVVARAYTQVKKCDNLAGGVITVTQNVHDSSLSGVSQPDILKVGGVLAYTNSANATVLSDASNAAPITVTTYADHTVNGTKPAESNYVGVFVGGVLGLSSNAGAYSVRCRNLSGADVIVNVGDKVTRVCIGGVAGQTHGGFKDFVNSASLVKFTGGAYTTDGVYCRVGGLVAHTTGQANMIESYTRNANEADIEVESAGRLMVGGAIGYSVRDCSNVFNEGDVTVVAKSNLECVGGLIGQFNRNNLNNCGTSGNVSLTRDAGSTTSISGVSGLGLAVGYSNAEASFKNCTVSGTLTRTVKDSSNVPFGIAAGKLNNALTLGAAGAPFTIKDGSILNGTAITSTNYSDDAILVGNLNSKALTKTNVAFE